MKSKKYSKIDIACTVCLFSIIVLHFLGLKILGREPITVICLGMMLYMSYYRIKQTEILNTLAKSNIFIAFLYIFSLSL